MSECEDPGAAGEPRTQGPTRTYEGEHIRVFWDATRCIHTGLCLMAEPGVFDLRRRPWVDVTAAEAEAIAAAIRLCPTGALRYEGKGDFPDEAPDAPTTIEMKPNGPMLVRGRVQIRDRLGRVITDEPRVALCRCGSSQNKPFCDNSHRLVGFRDPPLRRHAT